MEQQKRKSRRRGTELEDALLTAAWQQLHDLGYQKLTIEGIAAAAGTTKTVLYRRWPKKAQIVVAAFKRFGPKVDIATPNTGDLRTDLLTLLSSPVVAFSSLGQETIQGLISEQIGESMDKIFAAVNSNNMIRQSIDKILTSAAARGEVNPDTVTERMKNLPTLLFINELLTHGTLTKATVAEIVDTILMPLYQINGKS
ncbi:TetR/AcrR family transcriptional regulator [Sporolactobacillus shoreicorticis]|uniref:TetR/AcrR family transcriptional regulator n=1 Tax=Sporolactobacillus shoreicorticis TaxID=1923877 RepID=A0ABW5S198_9BACL|nr:TetR/AcrR family transcriptional regulator [Sporolactobacillus shoreicorticis]MCO7125240.1 TetR/AcrR family transcriptional regulator [Sporolactobacillus shoreicorticis]